MEPTRELIDSIYIEKVLRARRTLPEQRFLAGARLFEYARTISECGIRMQNPDADPDRVRAIFRWRLKVGRILDNS